MKRIDDGYNERGMKISNTPKLPIVRPRKTNDKPTSDQVRNTAYADVECLSDWPSDADQDYAERVLRARYYRGVRSRAQSYVEEMKNNVQKSSDARSFDDAEAFHDRLRQDLDGDQDVIYTHNARRVGYLSDYVSEVLEYIKEMAFESATAEVVANVCLEHDVLECIEQELGMAIHEWFEKRGEE